MPHETIEMREKALVATFQALDDWHDRYCFIMDFGENLPTLPACWHTPMHRIHDCASRVWLRGSGDDGRLGFLGACECPMDTGLLAIAAHLFSGQPAEEIIATPPTFVYALGLPGHMSAQRVRGALAMVHRMRHIAIRYRLKAHALEYSGARRAPADGMRVLHRAS